MGGLMSMFGMMAFLKASGLGSYDLGEPVVGQAHIYRSAYFGGSGDLFAPFPPEQVGYIKWIAAVAVIGGIVVRFKSYWSITEEDK